MQIWGKNLFLRLYEKDWVKKNISQLCYTMVELIDGWYTDDTTEAKEPTSIYTFDTQF